MIETRIHARLSPSSASRWMSCPGSVRLCETVVDAGSDDANRGTACHAVLERCLKEGSKPADFVGKKIDVGENGRRAQIDFIAEMATWVDFCLDWIRRYMDAHPESHLRSEERICVGRAFGCPDDLWGTADVVIAGPTELVVADAKFGYNEVAITDNPQLLLYLIGVAADYGWVYEEYRIAILQPQCGDPKEHTITRDDLLDVVRRYAPKITATQDPEAPLVPSDVACHWCAAAGVCPALHQRSLILAQREFVSCETLSTEDLATLLEHADRIRAGLEAAQRHAVKLIQLGGKVPGYKIVAGDKRRVWKDEASASKLMRKLGFDDDDIAPRKTVTPAQAEKLVGRASAAKLAPFIEKPKGEATLARVDDPRPSLTSDFEPIAQHSLTCDLDQDCSCSVNTATGIDDLL